jgi:hydroxyacylglutathione hydrolase
MVQRLHEIAPGVLVATAERGTTTSTVVVGDDGECLVIDPAMTAADIARLATDLTDGGLRPQLGFATHPHWDHVLWSRALGDVPRYGAPAAVQLVEQDRDEIVSYVRDSVPGHDLEMLGRLVPLPAGSDRIPWDGRDAQVIVHDGHAPGHTAVFLPDVGVLVAGDMLSDIEIPLLDLLAGDPLGDYRVGLDRLAAVPGVRWLVPGHGHIADAREFRRRVDTDYRYLDRLVAGARFDDSRCAADWLRDQHAEQLRRYGSA